MAEDFFNINPDVPPEESLSDRCKKERKQWNDTVDNMSVLLKEVKDIPLLMVDLYSERQRAAEYYHYIISILIPINRQYNAQYNERYDFYTLKSQIRYPNETTKNSRIFQELADIIERREILNNHAKFMLQTVSSIDAIIYAVNNRIKYEEIKIGK